MSKIVRTSHRTKKQVEDGATVLAKLFPKFPVAMLKVLILRYKDTETVEAFLVERGWKRNSEVLTEVNKLREEAAEKNDIHVRTKYYHGWYGTDCLESLKTKPPGSFMTVVDIRDGSIGYFALYKNAKGDCNFRRLEQPAPFVTKRQVTTFGLLSPVERPEKRIVCRACRTGPCKLTSSSKKKKASSSSSEDSKAHTEVSRSYPIYIPSQKIFMAQAKGF